MNEIKCCLGAHIDGYGHSRNCRGGLVNWADEFSDIKKEITKLTKQNEIMKKALQAIAESQNNEGVAAKALAECGSLK